MSVEHASHQPFLDKYLNHLELGSLYTSSFTFFFGINPELFSSAYYHN
jgi:hypothetical protein